MKYKIEYIDQSGQILERRDLPMTKVQKQKASKRPIRDQMELWRNHENRIKELEEMVEGLVNIVAEENV